MQELFDSFLEAVRNKRTDVSVEDVQNFIKYFPGGLSPDETLQLKAATEQRFGLGIGKEHVEVLEAFANDGSFAYHLPAYGFINMYCTYTKELEAPLEFQYFCAMVVLGQVIGRRRWIDRGAYNIYPPMPVLLVAPSGICRKTSAVQLAVKLSREIQTPVVSNKVTPEDLVRQLQDSHKGGSTLLAAPELAVLIGKQKYNIGLIELLTDLLDCPDYWESGTIMRGHTELRNVTLGFLGASTPKWLKTSVPVEAFAGGFMSRLIMVVKNKSPRICPNPPPLDKDLWEAMKELLISLGQEEGPVELTPQAFKWHEAWYRRQRTILENSTEDFVGYQARKPDHLFRLALNLQISRGENKITDTVLEEALKVIEWLDEHTPAIMKALLASETGDAQTTIVEHLRRKGGHYPRRKLIKEISKILPARLFADALSTLLTTQQIGIYNNNVVGDVFFLKDWED